MKNNEILIDLFKEIKDIRQQIKREIKLLEETKLEVKVRKDNLARMNVMLEEKLESADKGMVQTIMEVE